MPKGKTSKCPDNWPCSMPYLSQPVLAPLVPKEILTTAALTSASLEPGTATIAAPTTPYTNIRITPITDPAHPANGQYGLFATRPHPPDTFICLYLGLVHIDNPTAPKLPSDTIQPKSDYDLSLDRDLHLAIDAADMGNEARFTNDYRGIVERPNAEFRDVIVKRPGGSRERGVGIFVKAPKRDKKGKSKRVDAADLGIAKGQEILVSYGRAFWSARRSEAAQDEAVDVLQAPM
jgi:hypothetical protein